MTYAFGDSAVAVERLALLDRLFAPATEALLRRWAPPDVAVAVDVGCGPGHTTASLARICRPRRLAALDVSPAMAAATAARLASGDVPVVALVADAATGHLPVVPADLVHARYLLAHLRDPLSALDRWCTRLAPGGRVLVDEIEAIETSVEPLGRYLDLVTAVLAADGADLYVGRRLRHHRPPGTAPVGSEPFPISPPVAAVARVFGLNLSVWRTNPVARALASDAGLDALAGDLAELAGAGDRSGTITWTHRQVAQERPAPA